MHRHNFCVRLEFGPMKILLLIFSDVFKADIIDLHITTRFPIDYFPQHEKCANEFHNRDRHINEKIIWWDENFHLFRRESGSENFSILFCAAICVSFHLHSFNNSTCHFYQILSFLSRRANSLSLSAQFSSPFYTRARLVLISPSFDDELVNEESSERFIGLSVRQFGKLSSFFRELR